MERELRDTPQYVSLQPNTTPILFGFLSGTYYEVPSSSFLTRMVRTLCKSFLEDCFHKDAIVIIHPLILLKLSFEVIGSLDDLTSIV